MGTLCFEYDRYKKLAIYGWPEEVDMMEEWFYILGIADGLCISSPYHNNKD